MRRKTRNSIATILALILCFALFTTVASADDSERGVARFEEIIAPQFENAGIFEDGLAPVKIDGKWGYIDLENNVVISFDYDYACFFSEGYAVVGKLGARTENKQEWDDETQGFVTNEYKTEVMYIGRVDIDGNYKPFVINVFSYEVGGYSEEVIFRSFESWRSSEVYYYYGGWACIEYTNRNDTIYTSTNIFDVDGNAFSAANNEIAVRFAPTEGLIACGGYGYDDGSSFDASPLYLDKEGNLVLYSWAHKYFDANGNELIRPIWDWSQVVYEKYIYRAMPFNQGLAPAWECTVDRSVDEGEWSFNLGFIDRSGNWAIEPQFDDFFIIGVKGRYQIFSDNGLASLSKDGRFGAIDKTGRVIIPHRYDALWPFSEGLAVFEQHGFSGYIDLAGNEVIPAKFVAATGFNNGYAVASNGTKAMLIDRSGNPIQGADTINLDAYYIEHDDGFVTTHTPGEYITIVVDGVYGFGKLYYDPPLPEVSEIDNWAYDEVIAAIEENLVPPALQNQYRSSITRDDYCRLIIRVVCEILDVKRDELVFELTGKRILQHVSGYPFIDSMSYDVIAAYALGLVTGYDEGGGSYSFRPNNFIVRQEAAVLLWRAAGLLGMDNRDPKASGFSDRSSVPDWALVQVDYVNSIGVMRGIDDVTFSPAMQYSRQQAYMTAVRLLNALLTEYE